MVNFHLVKVTNHIGDSSWSTKIHLLSNLIRLDKRMNSFDEQILQIFLTVNLIIFSSFDLFFFFFGHLFEFYFPAIRTATKSREKPTLQRICHCVIQYTRVCHKLRGNAIAEAYYQNWHDLWEQIRRKFARSIHQLGWNSRAGGRRAALHSAGKKKKWWQ